MELVLHADFLLAYLSAPAKFKRSDLDRLRTVIVENNRNKIILSQKYVDLLEDYFSSHGHYERYTSFMTELLDNPSKYSILSTSGLPNIDKEFEAIYHDAQDLMTVAIVDSDRNFATKPSMTLVDISCIRKPNIHFVMAHICAYNQVSLRYFDFSDDSEINALFSHLFSFPKKISAACIFDKFCNLDQHNLFRALGERRCCVRVYTLEKRGDQHDLYRKVKFAKEKLGKTCQVYGTYPQLLCQSKLGNSSIFLAPG